MAKLFSIYILFIVAFLAIFHVARYAWVLHAIQRDRVICFVEPDPVVLCGELVLAGITIAMLIGWLVFTIRQITKSTTT